MGCSSSGDTGSAGSGGSGTAGTGGDGGAGGDAPPGGVLTKDITLGCSNNLTVDISILPADLQVDSGPITGGAEFAATLSGTVFFPVSFLDVAQSVIPGGLQTAQLLDARVIVQTRSGATETNGDGGIAGRTLVADLDTLDPGLTSFCDFSLGTCSTTTATTCADDDACPAGETCVGGGENVKTCDQANDNADGSNPACLPVVADGPFCQDPVYMVTIPTSDDCAAGGTCDALGKTGGGSQCELNGFCVTGDLALTLEPAEQTYMADATGDVLFGWADQGLSNITFDEATGLYDIPMTSLSNPLEQGIGVVAGTLPVQVGCVMAVDSAGPDGVAACVGGENEGDPCESPADIGNDICFGGTADGDDCAGASDCPEGECANVACGAGATCEPTDNASLTPDSALIRYSIP